GAPALISRDGRSSGNRSLETPPLNAARHPGAPAHAEPGQRVGDGLYTLGSEMTGIKRGHATGVVVLHDGRIMGGDSFFSYTGSYSYHNGQARGEMIEHHQTDAAH